MWARQLATILSEFSLLIPFYIMVRRMWAWCRGRASSPRH
jgi:hypothetical protein